MDNLMDNVMLLFSTVLGVVLGWILNNTGKMGKIYVLHRDTGECGCTNPSEYSTSQRCGVVKENSSMFAAAFELDISNSSVEIKALRGCRVRICGRFKTLEEVEADIILGVASPHSTEMLVLNLLPKQSCVYTLYFKADAAKMAKSRSIYITYYDEKNKFKKVRVLKYRNIRAKCTVCVNKGGTKE